jgi:hypothetical protein
MRAGRHPAVDSSGRDAPGVCQTATENVKINLLFKFGAVESLNLKKVLSPSCPQII